MPAAKASAVLAIHQRVREQGPEAEQAFLSRLSPGTVDQVRVWVPTAWVPLAVEAEVLRAAVGVLYADDTHGLRRLGEHVAQELFAGTYKVFLKVPTPEFFCKRFATVWRGLYDQGTASAEAPGPHRAVLLVRGFPELMPDVREYLCGFWAGVLKLIGAKTVTVLHEDHFPMEWRWDLRFV